MGLDVHSATQAIIDAGRELHRNGWVPATSGNLSARLGDGTVAVTVSGVHKGRMGRDDVMVVDACGASLDDRRPSAETLLHTQLYAWSADIGAVLHVHSRNATLISRARDEVVLEGYELLKALGGVTTHATTVRVPVVPNDQDIPRLARSVQPLLGPDTRAYLIAGHGVYTWGATMNDALRHLEAFDFLFACELGSREARP
jgi:methylthioribulose-1-phosphate dehydratase